MSNFQDHMDEAQQKDRRKNENVSYEGIERRRAERVKGIVVDYKKKGVEGASKSAFLRDMSSKGLSISVKEKLVVGDMMDLSVYLTDVTNPEAVEAEIRWVRFSEYFKKTSKLHYDVGLIFSVIDKKDLKLICDYMSRHKEDGPK